MSIFLIYKYNQNTNSFFTLSGRSVDNTWTRMKNKEKSSSEHFKKLRTMMLLPDNIIKRKLREFYLIWILFFEQETNCQCTGRFQNWKWEEALLSSYSSVYKAWMETTMFCIVIGYWKLTFFVFSGSSASLLLADRSGNCKVILTWRKLYCLRSESGFHENQDSFKFWFHDYGWWLA